MLNRPSLTHRPGFWIILVSILLACVWLYLFSGEFVAFYLTFNPPTSTPSPTGIQPGLTTPTPTPTLVGGAAPLPAGVNAQQERAKDAALFALSMCCFPVFLIFSFWMVSQFVLPVTQPSERLNVFIRLIMHMLGWHGPAVFIREGQVRGSTRELQSSRRGVAFVDLTSAIVLERQPFISAPGGRVPPVERRRAARGHDDDNASPTAYNPDEWDNNNEGAPLVRVEGPGIVFTNPGERIKGTVSLRRQVRFQGNVKSITLDGFEVMAHIITIFTLGASPEELLVGYFGERPEDIQVITLDEKKETIKGSRDELDHDDKLEVNRYYQNYLRFRNIEVSDQLPPDHHQDPAFPPYVFDRDRIFKAIYAESRDPGTNTFESWQDLPTKVAAAHFRNLVSLYPYSYLYKPTKEVEYPLNQVFRPEFARRVRNQGVLAYRLVARKDGLPLASGQAWDAEELDTFPVQRFQTSKLLRDRGIRVVVATFPEIRPANPTVRQHLLDYWQAQWQSGEKFQRAAYDYEAIRLRAHARVQTQASIVKSLTEILKDETISRDMVVLRLMNALETFAKEPPTEKLLSHETMHMFANLQQWLGLLSDQKPTSGTAPSPQLPSGQIIPTTEDEEEDEQLL